jgi:hypothetical protein
VAAAAVLPPSVAAAVALRATAQYAQHLKVKRDGAKSFLMLFPSKRLKENLLHLL